MSQFAFQPVRILTSGDFRESAVSLSFLKRVFRQLLHEKLGLIVLASERLIFSG